MDQISGTTPADAAAQAQDDSRSAEAGASVTRSELGEADSGTTGFAARGRMRRRARFLRKARELAYRDLGGLVFNLHRFGQRNDSLVIAKLTTLGHIDAELRTLETALHERGKVTVLREAGITACARCAAIHSSEDRFCPNCGLSLGPHADLPIAGAATPPAPPPPEPSASEASHPAAGAEPAAAPPASVSAAVPVPARAPTPEPKRRPLDTVAAGRSARSPSTSSPPPAERSQSSSDADEPTEILNPPSAGP